MSEQEKLKTDSPDAEHSNQNEVMDEARRDLLKKLSKAAVVAPATLTLMSMEAKACSFSC